MHTPQVDSLKFSVRKHAKQLIFWFVSRTAMNRPAFLRANGSTVCPIGGLIGELESNYEQRLIRWFDRRSQEKITVFFLFFLGWAFGPTASSAGEPKSKPAFYLFYGGASGPTGIGQNSQKRAFF